LPFIKDKKVTLGEYIASSTLYSGFKGEVWKNIFFKVTEIIKKYDEYYDYKKLEAE